MFLFDTDTLTNIVKRRPSPTLLNRLKTVSVNQQYVSTITISEIVYGAYKSNRCAYHLNKLSDVLLPQVNIVELDCQAAYTAGRIRAELEKTGRPLIFTDIQIAAIAIRHKLTLITGNTKHFERIPGLACENWL
jgi:tRNA(fMet)-specific endonuclease VapC